MKKTQKSNYNSKKYKEYYQKNKERILKKNKKYRENNPEYIKKIKKEWYIKNRKKLLKKQKEYNLITPQKYSEIDRIARKKRYHNNINYRLNRLITNVIWSSLRDNKNNKKWQTLVGFTLEELKNHLERQFKEGMSWDNYGKWHIDHIKPKSLFNIKSYEDKEFKECWSLNNLQPLWAKENLSKYNKFVE